MTRLSFQEAADRVKGALDIIDVVQRHVILKKSGRNYTGKCPFHNDKNPSMQVSREKNVFKCFSCGMGGDALSFLMRIESKTYGEVIRELAQEQGLEILYEGQNSEHAIAQAAAQKDTKQKILDLNQAAMHWFQNQLTEHGDAIAMRYLSQRYSDASLLNLALDRFQIGYAPDGWENLTPYLKEQYEFVRSNPDLLMDAGLANRRDYGQGHYDRFRNRLIIPIQNEKGQVVAFGGRTFSDEDKPKYLNSPETVVYHKSQVLYGLYQAKESIRQNKIAIVMEGYFDVMTAHLAGITEAVGSCGTAMTAEHLKLLTRFGAETVYLAFDSDEAGLKAALSAIHLIEGYLETADLQLKVLTVPGGKDPDEFIRLQGSGDGAAFRNLMQQAKAYTDFELDMSIRGLETQSPEGRLQAVNRLVPVLAKIKRPSLQADYLKKYAEMIALSEEALKLELKRYEQGQEGFSRTNLKTMNNFERKKAISHHGPTSLQRNQPLLTDNMTELRQGLTARHTVVEKNLLRLALYSTESLFTMIPTLLGDLTLAEPLHQTVLNDLREVLDTMDDTANVSLSDNGLLGTLIDKMNHLYSNAPTMHNIFAELVLTAESFGDSLGLGELADSSFREKVELVAQQQVQQLKRCQQLRQLQALKANALQDTQTQVELIYQFQEHLAGTPGQTNDLTSAQFSTH